MVKTISTETPIEGCAVGSRLEHELLLACSRTCVDSENSERLRDLVQEDIDWAYLRWTAAVHGVMPLLYHSLEMACPDVIPKAILDQLRVDFYANSRRNSLMTRELLALLNLFNLHKIPAVSFKGPVLARSIYGDVALRQFDDVDLLVRKHDASTTKELLLSLGYKLYKPWTDGPAHREPTCTFVRNGIIIVDLHWGLTRSHVPFPIELEDLQDRLELVDLDGTAVSNLSHEDLLLILTMHGSRHLWDRLKWICDVAELLRVHQGMDWIWVMGQARMLGSERMLFLGLLLAHDLLGATIPEEVMQRLRADSALKSLVRQVQEHLFTEAEEPHGVVKRFVFHTRVRERLRDKVPNVLYLMRRTVTPTMRDHMVIQVPIPLSFIYCLIRPMRLSWKYALKLFKLAGLAFGRWPHNRYLP